MEKFNPADQSSKLERFGDPAPWAEPAWYNTLSSPYYNDSHRRLRKFVREYIDENVLPYSEEWEEAGVVPKEVCSVSDQKIKPGNLENICL